ncbi:phospholipase D/nuclease [Tuber magnatum]|uniref:phospholipase D n=1 Tax=Tuber magnatum TaxID=42249 RepID=A0A317SIK6_9PEZI|nr:phospholipase D/nuclease [Tuber magnatum]
MTPCRHKLVYLRDRLVKCKNLINRNHRHGELHERFVDEKREQIKAEDRFGSFAEIRMGNSVEWSVDGRWRLDKVLKGKAEAGVKIYITVLAYLQYYTTKSLLENLCPRDSPGHGIIVVMRRPGHSPFEHAADVTFYWAHHGKSIVIDHKVAFAGGLDLCFGGWDLKQHPLADVRPVGIKNEIWSGQDFSNNRVMGFRGYRDYGRIPWHDVSLGFVGPAVLVLAQHFVSRWNFVKRDKSILHILGSSSLTLRGIFLEFRARDFLSEDTSDIHFTPIMSLQMACPKGSCQVQIVRSAADWSHGILKEDSIANAYKKLISGTQHYVYSTGAGQAPIRNTIGCAIVHAALRAAKEKRKFRVIVVIPSIPGFPGDLRDNTATGTRAIIDCRSTGSFSAVILTKQVCLSFVCFFYLTVVE